MIPIIRGGQRAAAMRGVTPLDLVETIREVILAFDPDLIHPFCQLRP